MMKEKLYLEKSEDRSRIKDLLKEGKIGVFPTDTVYGICCRMDSKESVERVFEIKEREKNKPFLILAKDLSQAHEYAEINTDSIDSVKKLWPGPVTIVFKAKNDKVLPQVRSYNSTVAIRVPDYNELTEIIGDIQIPLVAPSANLSGKDTPARIEDIDPKIIEAVDFIVIGECKIKKPSTIIDCAGGKIKIIRKGAVEVNL